MSAGISVGESEAREPVRIFCLIVLTFANAHNNVWEKKYKRKKGRNTFKKNTTMCGKRNTKERKRRKTFLKNTMPAPVHSCSLCCFWLQQCLP